jgi:hypothetical protein
MMFVEDRGMKKRLMMTIDKCVDCPLLKEDFYTGIYFCHHSRYRRQLDLNIGRELDKDCPLPNQIDTSDILSKLEPFAQGCFSGNVSEWPQLKPIIKEAYDEIKRLRIFKESITSIIREHNELMFG